MNPNHTPRKRKIGANPKFEAMRNFSVRFYEAHKDDPSFAFKSKERLALYLHDTEMPRQFAGQEIPSWSRIRVWLPKEGRRIPRIPAWAPSKRRCDDKT
jgi:hypothetical protein